MRTINKILLITLFVPIVAMAQKPGGGVDNQSQDVVKNFEARLIDAEKVSINPILPSVDTSTKAQTYSIPNKVLTVEYQPPKMRPQSLPAQKLPPQYNGYAKLGYGFPNSPYGEAAYRFGDPAHYLIGAKIKHHSANANKSLENQRFSNTEGEVNGTFYAQVGVAVDAKLGYANNSRQYYGYDHAKIPLGTYTRVGTEQHFNTLSASAKAYNSTRTVADINYGLGFGFSNMNDNYANKETDINIIGDATKWFAEKHPLTVIVGAEFTKLSPKSEKTQDLNNIYLKPSFTYKTDALSLKLGANLMSFKDVFYPMPDIEANFNLAGKALGIFAGWKGDFIKNSYRNLTNYNPFINPDTLLIRNTQKIEYYGGIRGGLGFLTYSAQAGFSTNNNLALFSADTLDKYRRFDVVYDSVNIFNIRGAITAHPTDKLEITGTISQNIYSAKNQAAAWGLPSTDVNVGAKYKVIESGNRMALVKASLFVQNGVPYKVKNADFARLDPLFDVSLGGEYWLSKNIGVFLDINNLLNLKRQRWQNYPNFGLNILGGITARF
ncbi:MAG: hypothetical protein U5L45_17470 [Saprospiraceae bacterium]|nr:hypothetical protein [Saprospiraceae bacterium]